MGSGIVHKSLGGVRRWTVVTRIDLIIHREGLGFFPFFLFDNTVEFDGRCLSKTKSENEKDEGGK